MKTSKSFLTIQVVALLMITAPFLIGWAESFDAIQSEAGKIKSNEADFVQEKHMAILARPLVAKGRFTFQKPASVKWEYREPMHRVLLMNNGQIRRFIETNKVMSEERGGDVTAMGMVMEEISQWLKGRFDQNPMFTASLIPGEKILLTPKDKGLESFIQRIEMVLGDQPGIMKEVIIFENADSYTRFKFINPQLNQKNADVVFNEP